MSIDAERKLGADVQDNTPKKSRPCAICYTRINIETKEDAIEVDNDEWVCGKECEEEWLQDERELKANRRISA